MEEKRPEITIDFHNADWIRSPRVAGDHKTDAELFGDKIRVVRKIKVKKADWSEEKHNRYPKGDPRGGQFAPKGATGSLSAATLSKPQSTSIFESDQKVYERAITLTTPEAKRMLDRLGMSREEALSRIEEAKKIQSTLKPTIDKHMDKDGHITEERMAVYQEYIDKEFSQYKPVPAGKTPHLLLTGGLPGAGKSTMLRQPMFEKVTKVSVDVDADSIRAYLAKKDGLDKVGAHAASYQDETDIVVNAMLSRARDGRYNVIYDSTMKKAEGLEKTIQLFKENGYDTEAAFLEISLENSMYRATKRYLEGTRFVDPAYIATHDHKNIQTFLRLINNVDKWSHWNNEVPFGSPPELINSSRKRKHNGK
ncbi:MAG: zeta toxin family protein [Sphaerochaeta sp.]|jgi:predicted ABC-type ATPase|nr:zeta toxin family protein [Sphaerochaeta sp.]